MRRAGAIEEFTCCQLKKQSLDKLVINERDSGRFRDGPLENLLWGGGVGRSTKKIFAQGKIKRKKFHARQLTLKNIHAMA